MSRFHHVVLFTLHEDADPDGAVEAIESSRPEHGLITWTVRRSIDARKGVVIAEVAEFVDKSAFQKFQRSPGHVAAGEYMSKVSDWVVADWLE